jgi:DNA-binding IclR family transcriptional regulator
MMIQLGASRAKKPVRDSELPGIRVIARAADILRTLGQHPEGLTIREIGALIGVPRSTVQRIVDALDRENLVISASAASGVRLGPALIALAALVKKFDIVKMAGPVLRQLAKDFGETVDLAVLDRDKTVVVDQVAGTQPLQAVSFIGSTLPLYCSATGKAVLGALADDQLAKIRKSLKLEQRTKNTIVTWEKLEHEIERVRNRGIAVDREECFDGVCAVGAALLGRTGEVAAISIVVPRERFIPTEETLATTLADRCRSLQRRI